MVDEQGFSEAVSRLEKVNEVVGKLDPAIRAAAFAALSGYVSGSGSLSGSWSVLDSAGGDIEQLAFIVMMEAAKSAEDDLKQIMSGVRAITAAKRELRALICKVANDIAENTSREQGTISFGSGGLGSEEAYHRASLPLPSPRCDGGVVVAVTQHERDVGDDELAAPNGVGSPLKADADALEHHEEDQRHQQRHHTEHQVIQCRIRNSNSPRCKR
jgi:hypothetical protein